MSTKRFKVGQKVIRARRGAYQKDLTVMFDNMTISKVGVRYAYATADRHGFNFEERFDGNTGKGNLYREGREVNQIIESREAFELEQRDLEIRQQFARAMRGWLMRNSEELPVENIRQAAELLGLKLDEW